ncbi:MAG: hypothetical protein RL758_163 [Pseudomonadota bacterium]|jgi:hypothetical protein
MTTTQDTTAVMRQALEALETCEWDGSHEPGSQWFDIDKVKEAIRALRSTLDTNGWQPIETAPKDGYFLAFKPGTAHIVATILDMDHPDCEYDGGVHEAWSLNFVDGVTHWMPLPSAPVKEVL